MVETYISILLTVVVAVATLTADGVAKDLVSRHSLTKSIERSMNREMPQTDKLAEIERRLTTFRAAKPSSLVMGSDLTAISFSIDLAALGIYVTHPNLFPFFTHWDRSGVSYALPVWLILLFSHFIFLLVCMYLKYYHSSAIDDVGSSIARFPRGKWFMDNRYMLLGNVIGLVVLFSSFVVVTYRGSG